MRRYALIGRKLSHSFSKRYFTEKFNAEGIDACYELIELEDIASLRDVVTSDSCIYGLNVTIPYKQTIMPLLDEIKEEARAVGAVNCISVESGRMVGHNTDIEGIAATLDRLGVEDVYGALVLGTGGASKAVGYVLRQRDIPYHTISRSGQRGDFTYNNLPHEVIANNHLIINTTPLGMYPDVESLPAIDFSAIGSNHTIFDLVYNPEPTLFMRRCEERGAKVIGGGLMLVTQAEASWRIWEGRSFR